MENTSGDPTDLYTALKDLCDRASLPIALTDEKFQILWSSRQMQHYLPETAIPSGALILLSGLSPEFVRSQIDAAGKFYCPLDCVDAHMPCFGTLIFSVLPPAWGKGCLLSLTVQDSCFPCASRDEYSRMLGVLEGHLRAPISSTFTLLEDLEARSGYGYQKKHIDGMRKNTFLLLRTSQWVFTHSRLAMNIYPAHYTSLDNFYTFFKKFCDSADGFCRPAGIPLTCRFPADKVCPSICDPELVAVILANLISNSCRYTRPGNQIDVTASQSGDRLLISVADRGLGIPTDILPHVFEPYFYFDHNRFGLDGPGLGLTIALETARLLKGTLALTSSCGEGTKATFSFPLYPPEAEGSRLYAPRMQFMDDYFSILRIALCDSLP